MQIKSLSSVCLWSENPDELAKFYKDVLKLPVDKVLNHPKDTGTQFLINDVYFFVGFHDKVKGRPKDPYRTMIGFDVESVKETYAELKDKVELVEGPSEAPMGGFYFLTVKDPEGNIIQFYSDNF